MVRHAARTKSDPVELKCTNRRSGDIVMYDFVLPARLLLELGHVVRLEDDGEQGVQRALRITRSWDMAEAMIDGEAFAENIILNITGQCTVDEEAGTILFLPEDTRLEVIDGQHRYEALKIVRDEEGREDVLDKLDFACSAVVNAPVKVRRGLFLAQTKRRPVSRDHVLALQHTVQDFATDLDRLTYGMLHRLNEDRRSPLKDRIVFLDKVDGRGRTTLEPGTFKATSLHTHLKMVFSNPAGKSHVLRHLSAEERLEALIALLRAAERTFTRFMDPTHMLGKPLGITTLFVLLARHGTFHNLLREWQPTDPYTQGNMEQVLKIASDGRFQWKPRSDMKYLAGANPTSVAGRLNVCLERRSSAED